MFLGSTETWLFETQTNPRCTTEYKLIPGMEKTDPKILDTPAKWRFVFVPGATEVIRQTYFSHKPFLPPPPPSEELLLSFRTRAKPGRPRDAFTDMTQLMWKI